MNYWQSSWNSEFINFIICKISFIAISRINQNKNCSRKAIEFLFENSKNNSLSYISLFQEHWIYKFHLCVIVIPYINWRPERNWSHNLYSMEMCCKRKAFLYFIYFFFARYSVIPRGSRFSWCQENFPVWRKRKQ